MVRVRYGDHPGVAELHERLFQKLVIARVLIVQPLTLALYSGLGSPVLVSQKDCVTGWAMAGENVRKVCQLIVKVAHL